MASQAYTAHKASRPAKFGVCTRLCVLVMMHDKIEPRNFE